MEKHHFMWQQRNRIKIVRELIKAGANKYTKYNGKTAHMVATELGYTKIANLLVPAWYELFQNINIILHTNLPFYRWRFL